jgi:hypothetical protein
MIDTSRPYTKEDVILAFEAEYPMEATAFAVAYAKLGTTPLPLTFTPTQPLLNDFLFLTRCLGCKVIGYFVAQTIFSTNGHWDYVIEDPSVDSLLQRVALESTFYITHVGSVLAVDVSYIESQDHRVQFDENICIIQ